MNKTIRAACALFVSVGIVAGSSNLVRAADSIEKSPPATTYIYIKTDNAAQLREAFRGTHFARAWADPAFAPFKDEIKAKIAPIDDVAKQNLAMSIREIWELPRTYVSLAVIDRNIPGSDDAVLFSFEAGANAAKTTALLTNMEKRLVEQGAAASTLSVAGTPIHILKLPKPKNNAQPAPIGAQPAPNGAQLAPNPAQIGVNQAQPVPNPAQAAVNQAQAPGLNAQKLEPMIVWADRGGWINICNDLPTLTSVLAGRANRDRTLEESEGYQSTTAKLGGEGGLVWYVDLVRLGSKIKNRAAARKATAGDRIAKFLEVEGLTEMKVVAGRLTYDERDYDWISRTSVSTGGVSKGIVGLFHKASAGLTPPDWVPASASYYRSIAWNKNATVKAARELLAERNPRFYEKIKKGVTLSDGREINFDRDLIKPLGDRATVVAEASKQGDSALPRVVIAVDLESPRDFEKTLDKLFTWLKVKPMTRSLQGATIHDFDLPRFLARNKPGVEPSAMSVSIAHDTLFLAFDSAMLDKVLQGGAALKENAAYKAVAAKFPEGASTVEFLRPDERFKEGYDSIRSGKWRADEPFLGFLIPDFERFIDLSKLPDYQVIAKYLRPIGGYAVIEENGATSTLFSLRDPSR